MNAYQNPNLFNTILFNPVINNNLSYINLNPPRINANNESKPSLMNDINKMNPIYNNSFINFPFYNNINNKDIFKNPRQNSLLSKIINTNFNNKLNLFNNSNTLNSINLFNSSNFTSLFNNNNNLFNVNNFNNNLYNNNFNNNLLFNKNNPCISQLFEKNIFVKKNDLFNTKPLTPLNNNNNINSNNIINNNDKINLIPNEFNNSFDDIFEEHCIDLAKNDDINENSLPKKNNLKFEINCKRKRGRRGTDMKDVTKPKRVHTSTDYDNILRKVQVHYLTFIVNFINAILDEIYPHDKKKRFLNMGYDMKKIVNHNYIENLKNKTIGEILQLHPSPKYKIYPNKNINQENYQKIYDDNNFLKNFFDMNYLEFFNQYYYHSKRIIMIYGKQITFKKAKFFCDLLEKNKKAASKIEEVVKSHYNIKNGKIFVVDKSDNT